MSILFAANKNNPVHAGITPLGEGNTALPAFLCVQDPYYLYMKEEQIKAKAEPVEVKIFHLTSRQGALLPENETGRLTELLHLHTLRDIDDLIEAHFLKINSTFF